MILAVAWLQPALGVKDHVATLNETGQLAQEDAVANEVSFAGDDSLDHPHAVPGKPSKFDLNVNQVIETDDESQYQIEASRLENATAYPVSDNCRNDSGGACSSKKDPMYPLVSADDNATESDGAEEDSGSVARKDEKGNDRPDASLVDKSRRYARERVVKIRLSQGSVSSRKTRTFFNGESTEPRVTLS